MEQNNLPIVAKRIWSIVRVVYFMLRKNISKKKFMLDLNLMMKRGKVATKAISNLITVFHHHHHHGGGGGSGASHTGRHLDYEFSCSNSPAFPGLFHLANNKRGHNLNPFACAHAPPTVEDMHDLTTVSAVKAVLEMLNNNEVEASPALPGFGRTPRVRPLRITDSPFPLKEVDEDSEMVDKAAEEFIKKFYRDLKQQKGSRRLSG